MNGKIQVQVTAVIQETPAVKRFRLASCSGLALPEFSGGSHIITYLGKGLERHYSLTRYEKGQYEIAVRLSEESRGGSRFWHNDMKIGDILHISFPKNYFQLSFSAKRHIFYAAGIGITPFLSMMRELKESGRPFELHYAAKSREQCAFYDYLVKNYPIESKFYFSNEGRRIDPAVLSEHRIGTHVYFCGPDSFITEFTEAALSAGFPMKSVHSERFAPQQRADAVPFAVELSDGRQLAVPENKTLLDALLAAGVRAPHSCRVGRCGTCELRVASGDVDHRDSFLTEEERLAGNVMLACVSRAKSGKLAIEI
ncbi:PDR/VanB family oxidoreductase [Fictibacillus aquaticus]|uniref:PDR/VanB family oxidoreductase n=1 Tax=Fictibacillus aquaticus TaxID=2021314 RepID=UPI001F0AEF2E|nr:PDR/VanB family oxidoreductase [Fictibacillus aquaticus]